MKNSMSKLVGLTVIVLLSLSIIISSCKKKKPEEEPTPPATQEDLTAENDFALAENTMGDANKEADIVLRDTMAFKNAGPFDSFDSCHYVKKLGFPPNLIVEVHYNNCYNPKSKRYYNGYYTIIAKGNKYTEQGSYVSINFDNFYVNGNKMTGKRELIRESSTPPTFQVRDNCTLIKKLNGDSIHWETERTHTWITPFQPKDFTIDDVYEINSRGYYESYRSGIPKISLVEIDNLRRCIGCSWPASGKITIIPSDRFKRIINFGYPNYLTTPPTGFTDYCDTNKGCDSMAKVSVFGRNDILIKDTIINLQ